MDHGRTLILRPINGLGNRLLALSSAIRLAEKSNRKLYLDWQPEWACGAKYQDLFKEPTFSTPNTRHLDPNNRSVERHFFTAYSRDHVIPAMQGSRILYVQAYWPLGDRTENNNYQDLRPYIKRFRPSDVVRNKCNEIISRARETAKTLVGIHIRRTDNQHCIQSSPTVNFVQAMRKKIRLDRDVEFLLCTDCMETQKEIFKFVKAKIHLPREGSSVRDKAEGVQQALAEMLALSHTDEIIGSQGSSFTWVATLMQQNNCSSFVQVVHKSRRGWAAKKLIEINPGFKRKSPSDLAVEKAKKESELRKAREEERKRDLRHQVNASLNPFRFG